MDAKIIDIENLLKDLNNVEIDMVIREHRKIIIGCIRIGFIDYEYGFIYNHKIFRYYEDLIQCICNDNKINYDNILVTMTFNKNVYSHLIELHPLQGALHPYGSGSFIYYSTNKKINDDVLTILSFKKNFKRDACRVTTNRVDMVTFETKHILKLDGGFGEAIELEHMITSSKLLKQLHNLNFFIDIDVKCDCCEISRVDTFEFVVDGENSYIHLKNQFCPTNMKSENINDFRHKMILNFRDLLRFFDEKYKLGEETEENFSLTLRFKNSITLYKHKYFELYDSEKTCLDVYTYYSFDNCENINIGANIQRRFGIETVCHYYETVNIDSLTIEINEFSVWNDKNKLLCM